MPTPTAVPTPRSTVRSSHHMVASADQLATSAGLAIFAQGGNAVDAAIATNAAIAVTGPHLCGLGGDLFALVHLDDPSGDGTPGETFALNASGRAGSGADPAALRAEGFTEMPFKLDVRSVTVPGCVDGWMALHERFGSLPLATILAPARRLAAEGFPASPLLVGSLRRLDAASRANLAELAEQATSSGAVVRRPGAALVLAALPTSGRDGFYLGAFGDGLLELGNGLFDADDLGTVQANWVDPLTTSAFGVDLHTIGPNSQGYLTLAAARLAEQLDLPDDPDDPRWAHLLIEAATAAGFDRPDALHEHADGNALLAAIDQRLGSIGLESATRRPHPTSDGDTTYLCTAGIDRDGRRIGVSLIQSNASGFGSHLVEPNTGINLHNRGIGFNLVDGHPAEFGPGRRPPHTLAPRSPLVRGVSPRCSARWAATPSRRSCCRSPLGSSTTASHRRRRSTPPVGSCTGPTPASTPGPAPADRSCTSRDTLLTRGSTRSPTGAIAARPVRRGIQDSVTPMRSSSSPPARSPAPPTPARSSAPPPACNGW